MDQYIKLKLDKDVNLDDFLQFLDFHQFRYKVSEEESVDFLTLDKEKIRSLYVPEENYEEFKVMALVYKDLLANQNLRNLNIPIENSIIDYEKTRRIHRDEIAAYQEPIADEIFAKANEGENPAEKDMEDSFYGYKKKNRTERILEDELILRGPQKPPVDEGKTQVFEYRNEGGEAAARKPLALELLQMVLLLALAAALVFAFVLIR